MYLFALDILKMDYEQVSISKTSKLRAAEFGVVYWTHSNDSQRFHFFRLKDSCNLRSGTTFRNGFNWKRPGPFGEVKHCHPAYSRRRVLEMNLQYEKTTTLSSTRETVIFVVRLEGMNHLVISLRLQPIV